MPATTAADPCAVPRVTPSGPTGLSTFVADAQFATALAWAPDGRLFFAERAGTVKVFEGQTARVFAQVSTVMTERNGGYSERGLLGLAVSPTFTTDHFVYAFFSANDYSTQRIVRWRDCAGVAGAPETIITLPSGPDCCHKGGRIVFGPDGKLYVTLGDEHSTPSSGNPATTPAQDPSDPRGKILRYNPDGSIPADNPFGSTSAAWALGFRNLYSLAFAPDGTAFVAENGPTGDAGSPATGYDLAYRVTAGGRYRWPSCYGYDHPLLGGPDCAGRPAPEWSSERETLIPTGATYVSSAGPAPYAGHFVFCTYVAGMRVFTAGSPTATVTAGPSACRLDVTEGPDHALYFSDETHISRLG